MRLRFLLGWCLLAYGLSAYAEQTGQNWQKAWWLAAQTPQQAQAVWLVGDVKATPKQVPLGSLWKLFVYNYSVDNGLPDQPYQCHAGKVAAVGDEYCCSQDEAVTRDVALARSCGAYFAPQRLQIDVKHWRQYWQKQVPDVVWLHELRNMQPQTQSSVQDILTAMQSMSAQSVAQSRQALLGRVLQPQWSGVLPNLGGAYRFKTFTWQHPQYAGAYFGGGAGWLADGTVFWLGGTGSSREVMLKAAPTLAQRLPVREHAQQKYDEACITVRYFKRYPIDNISLVGKPALRVNSGTLRGQYAVTFSNGNALTIQSNGELSWLMRKGKPQIWGKLGLQEYVARVLDREADASKTEAAKALSIAARSYVFQNAQFHQGCWQMDDDSRTQRVSPNPASAAAKTIVAMTEDLTLAGSPIYYHQNKSAANTLNWQAAVKRGELGDNYLAMLHEAYPNASWRLNSQAQQCQRLPQAEQYIEQNSRELRQKLSDIAGFEPVVGLKVCRLDYGNPYSDQQTLSMFVRGWRSENDRITLWHEYLHLALRYHPNGSDEVLIESKAKQLAQHLANNSNKKIRQAQ